MWGQWGTPKSPRRPTRHQYLRRDRWSAARTGPLHPNHYGEPHAHDRTHTANFAADIADETVAETATEQASYLLQRALDILIVATPVEISDALPVNDTDTDALARTVDVLEQHLAVTFEAHHTGCATLEPRMIVAAIAAVSAMPGGPTTQGRRSQARIRMH